MAFAITQSCCNDASCLSVCPVNCIHPTPGEPDFGRTELLHIDPKACIDCGACADACPVDAISPVTLLAPEQAAYAELNAGYFTARSGDSADAIGQNWDTPVFPPPGLGRLGRFRVAIVGTGPAACYAAEELLRITDARITFFDRLSVPGGLARFGVAPDHLATRQVGRHFQRLFRNPRVTMRLGVDVGVRISYEQLRRKFDAVVIAVGASGDRELGIPGEQLPGVLSARTFVNWYNGNPEVMPDAIDLSAVERIVIIGNGNVALDAARILTTDPANLERTAIAPHALAILRRSAIREVVLLGRRGPEHAAFTRGECLALQHIPGLDLIVEDRPGVETAIRGSLSPRSTSALRGVPVQAMDWQAEPAPGRRIVFSFLRTPKEFRHRGDTVEIVNDDGSTIGASLVLRAIGYRGRPQPSLPYDETTGTITNLGGRVLGLDGAPMPGTYVVGWAKRGPTGGIGANKACAATTVHALVQDLAAQSVTA
jgi:ferredoxin--NADP+ reductase